MIPNHPEHDPDIQLLPFFAFSTRFFDSLYSTFHACIMPFDKPTQFLIQYQHYFFYPVMLFARFSLFGKSYHYVSSLLLPLAPTTDECGTAFDQGSGGQVQDVRDGRRRLLLDLVHLPPQGDDGWTRCNRG